MKNKLLALTFVSAFSVASQAGFFASGHNWNNPISAAMDTVKEVVTNVSDTIKDTAESAADKVVDVINTASDKIDVASLRGTHVLEDMSIAPDKFKWIKKGVEFERNYDDQPPLIPHKTEGIKISFTENGCLDCHSDENYKEEEADKISSTHFFTRDEIRLKLLSPRRYFCLQCHVPQADIEPLIGNDYINLDE